MIALIKKEITIPLVADIHFDYKMAIASMEYGADKIRINPGNIGNREKVAEVVRVAKERMIPIRVGVNSGSLEKVPPPITRFPMCTTLVLSRYISSSYFKSHINPSNTILNTEHIFVNTLDIGWTDTVFLIIFNA